MTLNGLLIPPSLDAKQALRLRRFGFAALSYALSIALVAIGWAFDFVPASTALEMTAACVAINLGLYAGFRSGFNLRFDDPSLTRFQILVAITVLMQFIYHLDAGRDVALLACFIVFLFGVFRLSAREFSVVTLYTLAAYALVINLLMYFRPQAIQNVLLEWMGWLMLAGILQCFVFIGGQISALRIKLRDREAGLRRAQLMARITHVITGPDGSFETWPETLPQMIGVDPARMPIGTREWLNIVHPDDRALFRGKAIEAGVKGARMDFEYRLRRADGAWMHVRQVMEPLRGKADPQGRGRWFNTIQDVTGQKQAESRIRRLNRVYAVLSGINTLIVRVRDRDELFREACRIAVEEGHFRLCWIGLVEKNATRIAPVASAGSTPEHMAFIKNEISLATDTPMGDNLVAHAIRDKKARICNDTQNDPGYRFRKEHAKKGTRSVAVLPLLVADDAVGVLTLYSGETGFFDDEEMKLLTELAGDIAFAIDHIGQQERLDYLAYYDELTGLANRRLFLERVAQYIRGAVSGGHKLALFYLDLERFRNINDSLGRQAGDTLLKQVAEWMSRSVGDPSLLARLGADHFAIVLPELKQEGNVAGLLEKRIRSFLDHPFRLDDTEYRMVAKIGVALFPNDGTDADTLLRNAEAALKKAKARGDRYLFYKPKMTATVAGQLTLENQLREALDKQEFVLHYQPKVNLENGKLTGAEALIRWNDPRTGLVPPGRFIPVLEKTGLIFEVGRWALRKAIEDYLRRRAAGLPAVRIAVNVSPLQLRNSGFIAEVRQAIGIDTHAAGGLELEITESLIMEDVKHSIASLQAIRAMGVTIAIDDFGTGFSSLSYLAKLPVDTLKIDRSFVVDMTTGPEGLALVSTIINLAHSLKLKVVAEGVETEEQSRLLRLLRCNEMQGFLFSKPVPAEIFEEKFLTPAPAGVAAG